MRQQSRLGFRDVNGVDSGESLAQDLLLVQQLNWGSSILRATLLDFRLLFRNMHMQRKSASFCVTCPRAKILDRDCTETMRRNSNARRGRQALSLHSIGQRFSILDEVIRFRRNEPSLTGIHWSLKSGSTVGGPQQGNADSDIVRSLDNQFR